MKKINATKNEVQPAPGPVETATGILGQLLTFTKQLAASETDPEIQIPALSKALGQRIEELKKVLPQAFRETSSKLAGGGRDEKLRIEEKIKVLHAQAATAMEVLQKAKARTADEMGNLTRTVRAIRAYSA